MFQPLSAYTAVPQMQQQQNLVDALRGGGTAPVGVAPTGSALEQSPLASQMPGMAKMVMPGLRGMVGQMAQEAQQNPNYAAMNQQAMDNAAYTRQMMMPTQGGG